jgi:arylsulfatase A-like enzyme
MRDRRARAVSIGAVVLLVVAGGAALLRSRTEVPTFQEQACGLPQEWLTFVQRGYFADRSGHISILPKPPAYMQTGAGGWSHSGPWPHLVDIPLVFYGPGFLPETGQVEGPATLADIAPTIATMLRGSIQTDDGAPLEEVATIGTELLEREPPRLVVTIVWDGGGWNVLENWPGDWENLLRVMERGVSYENATVGSSPSVTPAVHTTLGTGFFPDTHGITSVPVRDEQGEVVDAFVDGESSRFIQVPTLAERWDEQNGNDALIGMIGYEPWHLGMIGKGAEKPRGDKDHAAWLDTETNEWKTNPEHYELPPSLEDAADLDALTQELDLEDGEDDDRWEGVPLDDRARLEETPAFIKYHGEALKALIRDEGYGDDEITDLVFTNFKQIDRLGHYFNFDSPEVNAALLATDEVLGDLVDFLDEEVGRDGWVVVVTADHGQQPDAPEANGYGIDPNEIERDIDAKFGPITRAVWPTEVFLLDDELEKRDVSVAEVARFLGAYRLNDNEPGNRFTGAFGSGDRLFDLAVPSRLLPGMDSMCPPEGE